MQSLLLSDTNGSIVETDDVTLQHCPSGRQ